MQNRLGTLLIVVVVLGLLDWYGFQAVRVATQNSSPAWQRTLRILYWSFPVVGLLAIVVTLGFGSDFWGRFKIIRSFIATYVFIGYISKLVMIPFLLIDDIIRGGRWVVSLFTPKTTEPVAGGGITRSEFLAKAAIATAAVPAVGFTWGIISGAHDYRVRRHALPLANLPKAFDGLRIAQISDIHSGSFFNKTAVMGGVEMLLAEKPDIVFFTGDLVNDRASEVKDYIPVFGKIKAPLGVFSVLGNHDYGDYAAWATPEAKRNNLEALKKAHELMGFRLLLDEHEMLTLSGDALAILGIQNWGTGGFAQYGNLAKAHSGTQDAPVKLLLSHDPSHWDAQVRPEYPDIDVSFAGHTHGMQFGIETKSFKWSPVQYRYKQWAGMHQEGNQRLYVNRGYGYIGYPGRVGMPPEITIFDLKKA